MRFVDSYFPSNIAGYGGEVAPKFSTQLVTVDSGSEQANRRWLDPKREISLPEGVRDHESFQELYNFWMVMSGPFRTWPFRDWLDFATIVPPCDGPPVTSALDMVFGVGDGVQKDFQLTKTYSLAGVDDYVRQINFPVLSSVAIARAGVPTGAYTLTRPGGVVSFTAAPALGAVLTWGGLFDLQARFMDDDTFSAVSKAFRLDGFSSIPLKEVPYCAD